MTINGIRVPPLKDMIHALQRRASMTQEDIRDSTGFSQNFISNLKLGRRQSVKLDRGLRLYALYAERVLGRALVLAPLSRKAAAKRQPAARRCA